MIKVAFIQKEAYEKLSVHCLAGALKQANIDYQIFIYDLEKDFYQEVQNYNPEYIVYSLYIAEESFALKFFKDLKQRLPKAKTLLGGPFTLTFPDIIRHEAVDYAFRGDGEEILTEFIKLNTDGKCVKNIPGICFINNDGIEYRNDSIKSMDLKRTPKPDRDLYYKYSILKNKPTKSFIASRGCPYNCSFCFNAELSKYYETSYWRTRAIDDVIEEIRYTKEKYGLSWVHFQDGSFNANKKWLKVFLKEYKKADLPPFLCNAICTHIDEDIIQLLKKAGCERITFGIQSGNLRIRKEIAKRNMSDEAIINACKLCNQYGIRIGVDIIFGWPSETFEEAMDTIRLVRQLDVETCSSNVLVFYPGLPVTRYAYENCFITKIPTLEEVNKLNFNESLLAINQINLFINIDKLFYLLIKFPKLEKLLLLLLKFPPNKFFCLSKNIHLLFRSLKYDRDKSKVRILLDYIKYYWSDLATYR